MRLNLTLKGTERHILFTHKKINEIFEYAKTNQKGNFNRLTELK